MGNGGLAINIDLNKSSAVGFRTAIGIDNKDRQPKKVWVEKSLVKVHEEHKGNFSNDVNIGLNLLYASRGWI